MKYAGFWQRFAAAFIDGLIVGALPSMIFRDRGVLSFLIGLGYSVWMLATYSQTVGMMVLKIKITKESGGKVTYQDAILRYFAAILSGIVFLLGYLWMLWDPKKQTWHDHIAKTVVVRAVLTHIKTYSKRSIIDSTKIHSKLS